MPTLHAHHYKIASHSPGLQGLLGSKLVNMRPGREVFDGSSSMCVVWSWYRFQVGLKGHQKPIVTFNTNLESCQNSLWFQRRFNRKATTEQESLSLGCTGPRHGASLESTRAFRSKATDSSCRSSPSLGAEKWAPPSRHAMNLSCLTTCQCHFLLLTMNRAGGRSGPGM